MTTSAGQRNMAKFGVAHSMGEHSVYSVPRVGGKGEKESPPVHVAALLDKLKAQLRSRGARGLAGLARKFKIMDDDGQGLISLGEFKKAMGEMEMALSPAELRILFDHFDAVLPEDGYA